jgi:hypothetical protein
MSELIIMREGEYSLEPFINYLQIEDGIMVEIGSYSGESAEAFAKSGKFKRVCCVDPWENGYSPCDIGSTACDFKIVEEAFDHRIEPFNFVKKIKALSSEAVKSFPDGFFDLVYIDGNHDYGFVVEDISLWMPKVKKDGYLAGHDYNHAVALAVSHKLGTPDQIFPDSSWVFKLCQK